MMCRSGFGLPVAWDKTDEKDAEIATFDNALFVASETLIQKLIFPLWVWSLPLKRYSQIDI
jgi:hypothetical protein